MKAFQAFSTWSPWRAKGMRPSVQIPDCNWNIQHPKWFPPRIDGRTLLIAAVQAARVNHLRSRPSMSRGAALITQAIV
jgi:hypothetical protein